MTVWTENDTGGNQAVSVKATIASIGGRKARMLLAAGTAGICMTVAARAEPVSITVATVNNGDMVTMQKLSDAFEKANPDIRLNWVVLEENTLRQRVTTDIATHAGQFDVLTIGNYEAPIWAQRGWLAKLSPDASYDTDDLLKPVRDSLSYGGAIYALPFYAESAMTYYRTDLFAKAGLSMPSAPTYEQIRQFADKLTDKSAGIYGMCLRGKPGWGENMAFFTTLLTATGGQWFGDGYKVLIDTPAWHKALSWYDDILKADGPPGATSNGFNENLALFASGHCGMWIDSTVAAGLLYDKKQSTVADKVGFASVPSGSYKGGPTWLWSWALAVPVSSTHKDAAEKFVTWATSKAYVELVAKTNGWVAAPAGTRQSTYANAQYKAVAPFAGFVRDAIDNSNPNGKTAQPRPYVGAQFVGIPEFQGIGTQVGQTVAATLSGGLSVDQALRSAQSATQRAVRQAGLAH